MISQAAIDSNNARRLEQSTDLHTDTATGEHRVQDLRGKRALVTGATSGIGRATAEALAREGAHVLISGRSEARGAEVVAAIEAAGGQAEFVRADLESPGNVRALAERAADVGILVNNAASSQAEQRTSFRRRPSTRRSRSTSRRRSC